MTVGEGQIPPHDHTAETAVLSAVMLGGRSAFDDVSDVLTPDDFYSGRHRAIFAAARAEYVDGGEIDMALVGSRLRSMAKLEGAGGMPYLTEILNDAPSIANVRRYALRLREFAVQRRMLHRLQRAVARIYAGVEDTPEFLNELERDIHAATNDGAVVDTLEQLGAINKRAMAQLNEHAKRGGGLLGYSTGYPDLDETTGGVHPSDLTIVAARPGMGKTSFVMNIATNIAERCNDAGELPHAVIVFSLEMPKEQLALRTLCAKGKVDLRGARTGLFSMTQMTNLTHAAAALEKVGVFIDDTGARSIEAIRSSTRRKQSELLRDGRKLCLVAIDYLQLMKLPRAERHDIAIGIVTSEAKAMAKELDVPVVLLSQLNRKCEERPDKRPVTSDLKDSGSIEQDADNIFFIYRDDHYNGATEEPGIAEILIDKQRNGPRGTVKLRFDKEWVRFDSLGPGDG